MLVVERLCSGYAGAPVVREVSMVLPSRGAHAIVGRNGAGKTTLLQTLTGHLRSTSGAVRFLGEDITRATPAQRARRGIGYVPQEHAVFPTLTVAENLTMGLRTRRPDLLAFEPVFATFPKLRGRLKQKAGTLSGGERKMLSIGRAILGDPRLLVMDEPTEGVWQGVVAEILDALRVLARERAVLIVEQNLDFALDLCDDVSVLDRGSVVLSGTTAEVRGDPDLVRLLAP